MKEKVMYFVTHWKPKDEASLLLYVITFFYTVFLYAVVIADAVFIDFKTPDCLLQVYYGLVSSYIGVTMIERCFQRRWKERSGERLVLFWFCTFLAIVIAHLLTRGIIEVPEALNSVVLFVIASFYSSRGLKAFYEKKIKKLAGQISKKESPNFRKKRRLTINIAR